MSYLGCLRMVIAHTMWCFVGFLGFFVFCFCLVCVRLELCVPKVACFSGLSIHGRPIGFL